MNKIIQVNLFCIFSILFSLSYKQSFAVAIDTPVIKAGTAKLKGRITRPNNTNKDNIFVNIIVPHPISGEYVKYKTLADQSGKFTIDVDVETAVSLIRLHTSLNPAQPLLVKLTNVGVTNLDIVYNSDFDIKNINVTPVMNKNDMNRCFNLISEMLMIQSPQDKAPEPLYKMSPDYFLNYINSVLSERLAIINKDTLISKELKGILYNEFRLFIYREAVFDYRGQKKQDYRSTNDVKNKELYVQKIDRSFYCFLKDFKLNNPQYLYAFTFLEFQNKILQNDILGLPVIGENDIPSWLAKVKIILSDLVGFNNGPYYDILAANAYGRQLNEELRPLSEKQKENIKKYWKNGEIAKILFRKNHQVIELDKFKSPVVVNEVTTVPNDKVIEKILSKYEGKVVFIDLWATWCAPCLDAMKEFRTTKGEFHGKDVVFVYLTNGSSPRKLWEEKIKGIGSEHYYLNEKQWEYVMDHFGLEYIPSYLLYNKEGKLIKKYTPFPGNNEVKEMINGLL